MTYLYPIVLEVPLEEILPLSPASPPKPIISSSSVMSFLEERAVGAVPYVPLLKKKGNLPAVFFGGGEVIVELDDVVESFHK